MAHLPPNHPKELIEANRYHKYAGVAILLGILVSILFACNPQKPVRKSINRVLQNDTAFAKVGAVWQRLNPCLNDTVVDFISDTLVVHDTTTNVEVFVDTATKTIYKTVEKQILKKVSIFDTAYITDNRAINQLNEVVRIREKENENLKGQLTTTQKELKSYKLYLFGLLAFILLVLLVKAFKFVKKF
jgi:hypothetical protein